MISDTLSDAVQYIREALKDDVVEVNHPEHYGGKDNPYEVVKVAEAWGLDSDALMPTCSTH